MWTAVSVGAFALLFLGIPMWMIFLILAVVAMIRQGVSMDVVVQGLTGTINQLMLLAVPGFIFAGSVMGRGGMSARLIDWISSLLGRVPGGMSLTAVAAAELFGSISGSSSATVAALGNILYRGLRKNGFDERFALGLITSSGAIAIIIPPSITMILFSVMTNASIGKLFLAGFLPGILVGICLAVYCVWYALKHKITSGRKWSTRGNRAHLARGRLDPWRSGRDLCRHLRWFHDPHRGLDGGFGLCGVSQRLHLPRAYLERHLGDYPRNRPSLPPRYSSSSQLRAYFPGFSAPTRCRRKSSPWSIRCTYLPRWCC